MKEILFIVITACLTNNVVLVKFLGVCPFLGVSNRLGKAMSMAASVTVVMVLSAAVTWPLQHLVLERFGIEYMQTALFLFTIGALVQILEALVKRFRPALEEGFGQYLPLIAGNCAILGVCTANIYDGYTYIMSVMNALGSGLGFGIAMFMFSGIRERIEHNDIPESFKGLPITLISAAIVSLTLVGFTGLAYGLFGMETL
ncbi:MAG: electron transport complex protein RnfA [Firmicutes bacterium]|jgi:electron transport complex protein RnfA|nr:electron transport complex protein RnfA [Bacillota bacterium]MBR6351805.1 electron transport complex protein RnfA [Bacillota bacterium]